jgi:hypothetical protein
VFSTVYFFGTSLAHIMSEKTGGCVNFAGREEVLAKHAVKKNENLYAL